MKNVLRGISKEGKREFLSKLQSGNFTLLPAYEPAQTKSFDLQENGLYKCKESGEELTSEQILALPGYRMNLQLVSTRLQVAGEKPPSGYVLIPWTEQEYLNSLLKNKSDQVLTFDQAEGKFKTNTDSYTFTELMRLKHDGQNNDFIMDELTTKKYLEYLEKWC